MSDSCQPAQPAQPCQWCPRTNDVHVESTAKLYVMAVLSVPGKTPVIVTTPTYVREITGDKTAAVADLIDKTISAGVGTAMVDELKQRAFGEKLTTIQQPAADGVGR